MALQGPASNSSVREDGEVRLYQTSHRTLARSLRVLARGLNHGLKNWFL